MSRGKLNSLRILTLAGLSLAYAISQALTPVPEEGVIEEIVVTATKRSERSRAQAPRASKIWRWASPV